jgi:hypothetical protein
MDGPLFVRIIERTIEIEIKEARETSPIDNRSAYSPRKPGGKLRHRSVFPDKSWAGRLHIHIHSPARRAWIGVNTPGSIGGF